LQPYLEDFMSLNPKVIAAIEQLNYRVTVGDVAVKSGLALQVAQQALMTLAAEAGGHLQVTETGEVAYLFSKNFRSVLQAKFLKLRLWAWWQQIWKILFYLIRISFGILLIASICIIAIAIVAIIASILRITDSENSGDSGDDIGFGGFPIGWIFTDWDYFFLPNPYDSHPYRSSPNVAPAKKESMNFLEAVFSFLFGDGNPNHHLEERRWQEIGNVLRQHGGAVVAEQVIPFLEQPSKGQSIDDAMLAVLLRFNGQPEVSPTGEIVYHFPDLQTSVKSDRSAPAAPFLQEFRWKFSYASFGQVLGAIGLGSANLIGAIILGKLLGGISATAGFLALVQAIYGGLLTYGIGFLAIPLGRYAWIQWQNQRIAARNQARAQRAEQLYEPSQTLTQKLTFARQFARSTLLDDLDLVYTTEKDLLEQESENQAKTNAAWKKRLVGLPKKLNDSGKP
jgi:hypothetical protein